MIQTITMFFLLTLAGLAAVSLTSIPLGIAFFVWISVFAVMAISQFWALAADVFDLRRGARSYPKLAVAVALGAWTGGQCAARLLPLIGATGLMLFRAIRPQGALCAVPALMFVGYVLIAFVPIFSAIQLYKLLEDSSSYSLHNTARHALFLPASQRQKYEGQTTTDTVFWGA